VFSGLALLDDVFVAYMPTALPHLFVIDKGGTVVAEGHTVSVVEEALGGVG
jgi:hypothetical protein